MGIQSTVSLPGIWVEGFSLGLSAPEGSGDGDQAGLQGGPCYSRRRGGQLDGEDLAGVGIRRFFLWSPWGVGRLDPDRVVTHRNLLARAWHSPS